MKLVFDTNIFISAIVIPHSQAEKAIIKIIDCDDSLIISKVIIDEVLSVLSRKFQYEREAVSHVAFYLSELAKVVNPTRKIKILNDEPDNRILECAQCGKSDAIVTGDKKMLNLKEFDGIKIISLKEYLDI